MILFELLLELLKSLTSPNFTSCTSNPDTMSDLEDCSKAHDKIEKGNCKTVTPFIKYTEEVNEGNNRKTIAGQIHVPFYEHVRACMTSKNRDKKDEDNK